MKIPKKDSSLEKTNIETGANFGIGDEDIIIDIVRDKMYSNPKMTMVQEYLSNARDANRMKKDPKRIEVSLPTLLNPILKIRDYGPGISEENIASIYVKYGVSTKRNDTTMTGGYGVGSKIYFSYGESFIIHSYQNKVKKTYVAHKSVVNKGSCDLMGEEETSEMDGIELELPILPEDIDTIKTAFYKTTFLWENERPVILNLKNEEIPEWYLEPKIILEGDGYKLVDFPPCFNIYRKSFTNQAQKFSYIFCDGIPYKDPFDLSNNILTKISGYNHSYVGLCLMKSVQEISIPANRESIDTGEKNRASISKSLEKINQDIESIFIKKIQEAKNIEEIIPKFKNFLDIFIMRGPFNISINHLNLQITFKSESDNINIIEFSGEAIKGAYFLSISGDRHNPVFTRSEIQDKTLTLSFQYHTNFHLYKIKHFIVKDKVVENEKLNKKIKTYFTKNKVLNLRYDGLIRETKFLIMDDSSELKHLLSFFESFSTEEMFKKVPRIVRPKIEGRRTYFTLKRDSNRDTWTKRKHDIWESDCEKYPIDSKKRCYHILQGNKLPDQDTINLINLLSKIDIHTILIRKNDEEFFKKHSTPIEIHKKDTLSHLVNDEKKEILKLSYIKNLFSSSKNENGTLKKSYLSEFITTVDKRVRPLIEENEHIKLANSLDNTETRDIKELNHFLNPKEIKELTKKYENLNNYLKEFLEKNQFLKIVNSENLFKNVFFLNKEQTAIATEELKKCIEEIKPLIKF